MSPIPFSSHRSSLLSVLALILTLFMWWNTQLRAEDWFAYEGNNRAENSSKTDIPPAALKKDWQRRFLRQGPIDDGIGQPEVPPTAQNLVSVGDYIAVIGADDNVDTSKAKDIYDFQYVYLSLINKNTGTTENCIEIQESLGNYETVQMATDVPKHQCILNWDPDSKILYVRAGGDSPSSTAYLPLANIGTYTQGGYQKAVDAFDNLPPRILFDSWVRNLDVWYGADSRMNCGKPYANDSAFISLDPNSDFYIEGPSPDGHLAWGSMSGFNRLTGQIAICDTGTPPVAPRPSTSNFPSVQSTMNGTTYNLLPNIWQSGFLIDKNKVYALTFGQSKRSGTTNIGDQGYNSTVYDQGLGLVSWALTPLDAVPSAIAGAAGYDSAALTQRFLWRYDSGADITGSTAQNFKFCSWGERDYARKNKALMVDERFDGAWIAWKQGYAANSQLVFGNATQTYSYDLGIGANLGGSDFAPEISINTAGNGKTYIAYMTVPEKAPSSAADLGNKNIQLAVMDVTNPAAASLKWTVNIATNTAYNDYRRSDEWYGVEITQMLIAGNTLYVAWVDNTTVAGKSQIKINAYDLLSASAPTPVTSTIDLGISNMQGTCLIDMAAVDGKLLFWVSENNISNSNVFFSRRFYYSSAFHLVSVSSDVVPKVSITAPADGAIVAQGGNVTLSANATDTQDGNLSANVTWSSSINGNLGTGASLTTSNLSPGQHVITASVTDSSGRSSIVTRKVTVTGTSTNALTFLAGSNGNVGGTLSQTVNAYGNSQSVTATPNAGYYFAGWTGAYTGTNNPLILKNVTSGGSVTANFAPIPGSAPSLSVQSPVNAQEVLSTGQLFLSGNAVDSDVDLSVQPNLALGRWIRWISDKDGTLGRGVNLAVQASGLQAGQHAITASITDKDGSVNTISRVVNVRKVNPVVFNESGGIVSMEAENYSLLTTGSFPAVDRNFYWNSATDANASGGTVMSCYANVATRVANEWSSSGPGISFMVQINTPGTYSIHLRSKEANSFVLTSSLPGYSTQGLTSASGSTGQYIWTSITDYRQMTFNAPGIYTIGIRMTGSGDSLDKIVLKLNDTTTPTGTGNIQSQRVSTPLVTIIQPPVVPTTIAYGSSSQFQASSSDSFDGDLTSGLVWTSDLGGVFGNGGTASPATLLPGTHLISVASTNSQPTTGIAQFTLTVTPPAGAPVANAGTDITVTDMDANGSYYVTLDGSASSDADGQVTSWIWKVNGQVIGQGPRPTLSFPVGTTNVSLVVFDNQGKPSVADSVLVTVNSPSLVADSFNYPDGTLEQTNGQASGQGINRWSRSDGWMTEFNVTSGNLTYSGYPDGEGKSLVNPATGVYSQAYLKQSYGVVGGVPTHSQLWLSFLVQPNTAAGTFYMMPFDGTTQQNIWLNGGLSSRFGLVYNATTAPAFASGQTQLVVMRLDFAAGSTNSAYLWVNPNIAAGEPSTSSAHSSMTGQAAWKFDSLQFWTSSVAASGIKLDAVRMADSWAKLMAPSATNTAPTIAITSPANGSSASFGQSLTFNGTAIDTQDGNLVGVAQWRSNLDGLLGSGASLTTSSLSKGSHLISFLVSDSQGAEAIAQINLSITAPSGFASWQGTIAWNGADSSLLGDPDGDGIPNLIEYALGLNPLTTDPAGLPAATSTNGQLRISFNRLADRTDIVYTVEASSNLATWTPIAVSTNGSAMTAQNNGQIVSQAANGNIVAVTVGDDPAQTAAAKRFLRLKITKQ